MWRERSESLLEIKVLSGEVGWEEYDEKILGFFFLLLLLCICSTWWILLKVFNSCKMRRLPCTQFIVR